MVPISTPLSLPLHPHHCLSTNVHCIPLHPISLTRRRLRGPLTGHLQIQLERLPHPSLGDIFLGQAGDLLHQIDLQEGSQAEERPNDVGEADAIFARHHAYRIHRRGGDSGHLGRGDAPNGEGLGGGVCGQQGLLGLLRPAVAQAPYDPEAVSNPPNHHRGAPEEDQLLGEFSHLVDGTFGGKFFPRPSAGQDGVRVAEEDEGHCGGTVVPRSVLK